jgi:hypothetical protein
MTRRERVTERRLLGVTAWQLAVGVVGLVVALVGVYSATRSDSTAPCHGAVGSETTPSASGQLFSDVVIGGDLFGGSRIRVNEDSLIKDCAHCQGQALGKWIRHHADTSVGPQKFHILVQNPTGVPLRIHDLMFEGRAADLAESTFVGFTSQGGSGSEDTLSFLVEARLGSGTAEKYLEDPWTGARPLRRLNFVVDPCDTADFGVDLEPATRPVALRMFFDVDTVGASQSGRLPIRVPAQLNQIVSSDWLTASAHIPWWHDLDHPTRPLRQSR